MAVICGYGLYRVGQGIREQKYVPILGPGEIIVCRLGHLKDKMGLQDV